jgi:hypothetical protein
VNNLYQISYTNTICNFNLLLFYTYHTSDSSIGHALTTISVSFAYQLMATSRIILTLEKSNMQAKMTVRFCDFISSGLVTLTLPVFGSKCTHSSHICNELFRKHNHNSVGAIRHNLTIVDALTSPARPLAIPSSSFPCLLNFLK